MSTHFDVEDAFAMPVQSSVPARWERKAATKTPSRTPKTPSASSTARTPRTGSRSQSALSGKKLASGKKAMADRFIPAGANGLLAAVKGQENETPSGSSGWQQSLAQSLFAGEDLNSKILTYKAKPPMPAADTSAAMRVLYSQNREASSIKKSVRHIAKEPERILDAPDLLDDYYLNLLDWTCPENPAASVSSTPSVLAVGLGTAVYLWNQATNAIDVLIGGEESGAPAITSVNWMPGGHVLAIGTNDSVVSLWDVNRQAKLRAMPGHNARVGALSWNGRRILSSGGRDGKIITHDVSAAAHRIATLRGHEGQEVCGLRWSLDGTQLASGGNDNAACIWDSAVATAATSSAAAALPRFRITESQAAVKALAWCPWQKNLLATGSGTADRKIRFLNTLTGQIVNEIDTGSQVSGLVWGREEKEIISSHGFSKNELCVWQYPTMAKVAELTGHSSRVLHLSVSTDGSTVCSAGADESLRFWRVWDAADKRRRAGLTASTKAEPSRGLALRLR